MLVDTIHVSFGRYCTVRSKSVRFCTQAELIRMARFEFLLTVRRTGHEGQKLQQKVTSISMNILPISLRIIVFDRECIEEVSDVIP